MAGIYVTLELTKLHALIGRLQSHIDDFAGRADVRPDITADITLATDILDDLSHWLEILASQLPPSGGPETSRSAQHGS